MGHMRELAPDLGAEFISSASTIPVVHVKVLLSDDELRQLGEWHEEKEGCEPGEGTVTPVWIKQDDGSWAQGSCSWEAIISDIKEQIKIMQLYLLEPTQHEKIFGSPPGPYRH